MVHITKPFRMAKVPVDRVFWREVMGTSPWKPHISDKPYRRAPDDDACPVIGVNWHECMEFCQRLSQRWGKKITLPSEMQWVYACKAGSKTLFPWGLEEMDEMGDNVYVEARNHAVFKGPLQRESTLTTAGVRLPNAWGLHDMIGLVSEWVRDTYDVNERNQIENSRLASEMVDPVFADGPWRVLKGGAWCLGLISACDLSRPTRMPESVEFLNGFRFIEELP